MDQNPMSKRHASNRPSQQPRARMAVTRSEWVRLAFSSLGKGSLGSFGFRFMVDTWRWMLVMNGLKGFGAGEVSYASCILPILCQLLYPTSLAEYERYKNYRGLVYSFIELEYESCFEVRGRVIHTLKGNSYGSRDWIAYQPVSHFIYQQVTNGILAHCVIVRRTIDHNRRHVGCLESHLMT